MRPIAKQISLLAVLLASPLAFAQSAQVGSQAPDFTLSDVEGKTVKLSDFKGKTVVLEWFNPDCPYVKNAHTKGPLVDTAKKHTAKGVVWLAINSNAAGKQGHGAEKNRAAAKAFGMAHPLLLDESGKVGKAYGATNTPHMFVIDKAGKLVYAGAIDNSPDGEMQSPTGGKWMNHVDAALEDLAAGRAVKTPSTKAYGCSVKFAG
jgi:peroxiredoxin